MDELQALLDQDNSFLASYLMNINGSQSVIDDRSPEEIDDYYDVGDTSEDAEISSIYDDDFEYGLDDKLDQFADDEHGLFEDDVEDDEENDDSFSLDYLLGDYSSPEMGIGPGSSSTGPGKPGKVGVSVKDAIVNNESGGRYDVVNPGSSATGKYQFIWSIWKNKIGAVTGAKSRQEFLNSPQAQDRFYDWYEKNEMAPAVSRLEKYNKQGLTPTQLGRLFHYRGEKGARDYLLGLVPDKPEANNPSISQYLSKYKQAGGPAPIAGTVRQQYVGLNDDSLHELILPLSGMNTIRGVDSGEPIVVTDSIGNSQILRGPYDQMEAAGQVYEKRLRKRK